MEKGKRYTRFIMICILMVFLAGESVQAEERGNVCIKLEEGGKGTSKKGVVFAYTKVADIVNGDFVEEQYLEGIELEELSTAEELQKAAWEIVKRVKEPDGTVVTDEAGAAYVDGLCTGVYLLSVSDKAEYDEVQPILLTVPSWNEKNEAMEYRIDVVPKHEPIQKDNPIAPQTNLNSSYKQKLISAGLCAFGTIMLFIFSRRKEEDEKGF